MKRTNVYLDDEQLRALQVLGEQRGRPMAELVREAVDAWLEAQGVSVVTEDEWQRRFSALLERRRAAAEREGFDETRVETDVALAVAEVRGARAARRR